MPGASAVPPRRPGTTASTATGANATTAEKTAWMDRVGGAAGLLPAPPQPTGALRRQHAGPGAGQKGAVRHPARRRATATSDFVLRPGPFACRAALGSKGEQSPPRRTAAASRSQSSCRARRRAGCRAARFPQGPRHASAAGPTTGADAARRVPGQLGGRPEEIGAVPPQALTHRRQRLAIATVVHDYEAFPPLRSSNGLPRDSSAAAHRGGCRCCRRRSSPSRPSAAVGARGSPATPAQRAAAMPAAGSRVAIGPRRSDFPAPAAPRN